MRMLTHDQNGRPMGLFVPWSDHMLFLHSKESETASVLKKCGLDAAREVIIVRVRTKEIWFWSLEEITVHLWDLPRDAPVSQEAQGGQHMEEPDTQYRAVA